MLAVEVLVVVFAFMVAFALMVAFAFMVGFAQVVFDWCLKGVGGKREPIRKSKPSNQNRLF